MGNEKKTSQELILLDDVHYYPEHTWAKVEGAEIRIGITDYAQDQLGEIIFIELPTPGDTFTKGNVFGQAESAKSVSSLYIPISGEILTVNQEVEDDPELVNHNPYEEGWIITVKPSNSDEIQELLTKEQYVRLLRKHESD